MTEQLHSFAATTLAWAPPNPPAQPEQDARGLFDRALESILSLLPRTTRAWVGKIAQRAGITAALQRRRQRTFNRISEDRQLSIKESFTLRMQEELAEFLSSRQRLAFPQHNEPHVSIVIVLFNRAELTLGCLQSLVNCLHETAFEIIIVDNASSDRTAELVQRIDGVRIVCNSANEGFLKAANAGARLAKGRQILFLNNDCFVESGSLAAAARSLDSDEHVGAVGARILLLDGSLQESGSIVWSDGTCVAYGRGGDPCAPEYMFRRAVDYVSGAFLLTPRALFDGLNGFDEAYAPAYYEETDYCFRLRRAGYRVLYEPGARIRHYEFASSPSAGVAIQMMRKRRDIFATKHERQLREQPHASSRGGMLVARSAGPVQRRVLFIEDGVPHDIAGAGLPRARKILQCMHELGLFVTFYPTLNYQDSWEAVYRCCPAETEVMLDWGMYRLQEFLLQRGDYYDYIFVSRPHNMQFLRDVQASHPECLQNSKIIYDAEAVFALRDQMALDMGIEGYRPGWRLSDELDLVRGAECIFAVSRTEQKHFEEAGAQHVRVLGNTLACKLTAASFHERQGILFVGPFRDHPSPNSDGVLWFVREILPLVRQELGPDVTFYVVGSNKTHEIAALQSEHVQIVGPVDDLDCYFNRCRVFVAPARFSGGIPLKIHDAASRGLPVVATSALANQLGWTDGCELLTASAKCPDEFARKTVELYRDPLLWNQLRERAAARVAADCSRDQFVKTLKDVFGA